MISSLDILWIVIAFAVLWITLFICYFIWQIIVLIRTVNDVLHETKQTLGRVEMALNGMKSKFEKSGEHLGRMADHMKDAAGRFTQRMKK